jgi:hypothetical protein
MRRQQIWASLVMALAVGLQGQAADRKDAGKKDRTTEASSRDYAALAQQQQVVGHVVMVSGTDRSLTIRVEYPTLEAAGGNAGRNVPLQVLLRQQQQILHRRNPVQAMQQMQLLLAQAQLQGLRGGNGVRIVKTHKEFELEATENAPVRILNLPVEYDEKGKQKKYTAAELRKMKGNNSRLPGYSYDFDKLRADSIVQVTLKMPKGDKEADEGEKRPKVTMIVVIEEGKEPAPGRKPNKEK